MTNKHTPGPWSASENTESGNTTTVTAISGSCELHIAEVTGSLQGANARLIAAAPDLLDALSDLLDQCKGRAIDRSIALAAIAKAEGR